jgi:hypothetical protein
MAQGPARVEFNRDVRPILSENCFLCHGPDRNRRQAELRLDLRDVALAKEAFVPGQPDQSEIIARITSADAKEVMPPPESTKLLTPAQKEILRRWVEQGAEYQPHWAYVPIRRMEPPKVRQAEWVANPIDAFILASLEARGVAPSKPADRRTLIRRLSLDLVGLPPTVLEVDAFVNDADPKAYEKLVDRLLASPHYGERMAVPWLDLARFADTVGYHGDQNQHVFAYRDYVIDAFNRNLRFHQFTIEQLAGDLLPDPTPQQRVASGFNRLNMVTREGGAQPREYLAKYAADRVRTTAITWLGSTMGCAECHDHKYDPFTARDFYRFEAFFADLKQWGVYADYDYTPNLDLRGVGNDHPFPPEVEVDNAYLTQRKASLDARLAALFAASRPKDPQAVAAFESWLGQVRGFLARSPDGWEVPPVALDAGSRAHGTIVDDRSLLFSKLAKPTDVTTLILRPARGRVASLRLEALPRGEHGGKLTRSGNTSTIQLSLALRSGKTRETKPLPVAFADATARDERYASGSAILGVASGWRTSTPKVQERQASVWLLDRPVVIEDGDEIVVTLRAGTVGCVRLAVSPLAVEDPRSDVVPPALLEAIQAGSRTAEQTHRLQAAYLLATGWDDVALAAYRRLASERRECREGKAWAVVSEARAPAPVRVLPRGNWLDETGDLVEPGVPGFLPQPAEAGRRRLTRLDLARWLTSDQNPLTPRVFANRLWKQLFGTGLSAVMEDVGAQGEPPSHPELLDWLASEFRDSGWDVKRLVKTIVMSNTYRQDARLRPELRESDPSNRLLASQNPRRLDAEFVRDNALAIAGLINLDVGGPSVHPYQPLGYYANIQFPDRDYLPESDDRQYRRGIYAHWQRTFLQPMLANFDAPSREECIAARTVANTPQQALTLLNDPTFVEAARVLAARVLKDVAADEARIDALYLRALARHVRPDEQRSLLDFLARQRLEAKHHPDEARAIPRVGVAPVPAGVDPGELAAWTEVCRVLLNLHETITRY